MGKFFQESEAEENPHIISVARLSRWGSDVSASMQLCPLIPTPQKEPEVSMKAVPHTWAELHWAESVEGGLLPGLSHSLCDSRENIMKILEDSATPQQMFLHIAV